ncbi:HD domain-containing protein [bacterium]|nr:HD domain-containing protein [bacterium]
MRHPYGDIAELAELQAGGPLIRIPDRLNVPFTPRVRALVDTPEYQRLAHISQLGLSSKVYPGATHTRFEHALGVFYNACRYLWQLGKDPRFADVVTPHHAEVLLTAALLHDIGHWPFCHPIEDLHLADIPSHEHFASAYLAEDRELAQVLRSEWQVEPGEVLDLLHPASDSPALRLMRSILSGPIDIDKLDYLERDSLHCGVPYGRNFDRERLVQSLVVNAAGDGLAISSKGKTAAELMVFARYVMFTEVYWHHAVRSATCMLARSFVELHPRLDLHALFEQREADFVSTLRDSAAGLPVAELLDGLFGTRRRLHKRVAEFSLEQAPDVYRSYAGRPYAEIIAATERFRQQLPFAVGPVDVLIDGPPVHKEVEFKVDIYFPKLDRYRSLGEVSPVVSALARSQFDDDVKRVRVFAAAAVVDALRELPDLSARLIAAAESP